MLTINIKLKDGREIKECSIFNPDAKLGKGLINDKNILEHVLYSDYNITIQNPNGYNEKINSDKIEDYEIIKSDNNNLYAINYKIEELNKQKEEVKKILIENKLNETTKLIVSENNKSPLSEREIKNFLKSYTYDIKEIIKD